MPEVLHVGDSVVVADAGRVKVDRIDVCLRPSTDPAGEEHAASTQAVELGEHAPPFVIGYADNQRWAYGVTVDADSIEGPYVVEKRCPRRHRPHLHEEEHRNLTLEQAIERIEDLTGISDPDGIGELEPGEHHTWTVDEDWDDEIEVRRGA